MKQVARNKYRILWLILSYGFIAAAWNLDYNSPYHDEGMNILMGRQVLSGEPCPACAQNGGSVLINPVISALGDWVAGIYGARGVNILFGLGLTAVLYRVSRVLLSDRLALLAPILFLSSGTVIYLSKTATYDMAAAFFLGLSFMLILESGEASSRSWLLLLLGSITLFLSTITKYTLFVFAPPLLIYVLWREKPARSVPFFLLPFLIFWAVYGWLAIYPAREALFFGGSISSAMESHIPFDTLAGFTLRWIAMPYLLAVFGFFHAEKGREALLLTILSTPVVILHFALGYEQSVNKDVLFSLVFLTPAAAVGIDHMTSLFSRGTSAWVKPLFTATLLLVVWAFGLQDLRWLERQYPDLTQVVSFFREKGHDNMTVVIDSDYGHYTYSYLLGDRFRGASFIPISVFEKYREEHSAPPDFIILDDYYGKRHLREIALGYMKGEYFLLHEFRVKLSWGEKSVKIFGRG